MYLGSKYLTGANRTLIYVSAVEQVCQGKFELPVSNRNMETK